MSRQAKEIIIYREGLVQSIMADASTFSFLLFSFWFNYRFVGGSALLSAVILILFLMLIIGLLTSKKQTFTDRLKLLEYLGAFGPNGETSKKKN